MAACELSGSWELPQVPRKRLKFGTGRAARLSPCSQRKEGSDKISLEEKCGEVVCVTAAVPCVLLMGPAGLSLSDTVAVR